MCNQSSRALHRLISAAAQLADKGELFKQQQRRGPALLDLAPKSHKKSVQRNSRKFPVVSEQEVIAHINHNRHKRWWCTFFKQVYFLAYRTRKCCLFWPALANLGYFVANLPTFYRPTQCLVHLKFTEIMPQLHIGQY